MMNAKDKLVQAMGDLNEDLVLAQVEMLLEENAEPLEIIELCRRGFDIVGERYERREYFLSGLILSDEIFKSVTALLERYGCLPPCSEGVHGKVVLGAPLGDVHDIGKGIVSMLLRCSGFEVIDLGVSVKPARFVEAVVEHRAGVVGISALITLAFEALRETVACFERAGLRDKVKIMLGGGAVSQRVCEYAGADAWGRDANDAVKFARMFMDMLQEGC
jgi:5-methyltetrahydrofolate--homocysteine methyltransferase